MTPGRRAGGVRVRERLRMTTGLTEESATKMALKRVYDPASVYTLLRPRARAPPPLTTG